MSRSKTVQAFDTTNARIVRRRGSKVRYQHNVTAAFSPWMMDPKRGEILSERAKAHTLEVVRETMDKMTVAELRALADTRGIPVKSKARKSEIITALTNV